MLASKGTSLPFQPPIILGKDSSDFGKAIGVLVNSCRRTATVLYVNPQMIITHKAMI
jgi:hypothetical protein